jgi:transcriptional regulator with XRE-family HTH domain
MGDSVNYAVFNELCRGRGTTVSAYLRGIGLDDSNAGRWKNGGNPSVAVLVRIAEDFGVSADCLLGLPARGSSDAERLDDDEARLVFGYRELNAQGRS